MVWNQNFEPDPTSHFTYTLSESEVAQKRARVFEPFKILRGICKVASWIGLKILVEKVKLDPQQPILAAKRYVKFLWATQ